MESAGSKRGPGGAKTISLDSEVSKLRLDGYTRGGRCPNGSSSSFCGESARSSWAVGPHRGSSHPSIACSQNTVEGSNGLSHDNYLVTTLSDHLEDDSIQDYVDETT
ncbi:hypothetical protein CRG98_002671 [Punica granatum]|uniref:Uncharacterized protein n=1 Tax=Punica granatum TaxID=22663 RepID=A0A2I0L849_PUNGR|nr:hypothetical protein CRG98_002671 [Punica granatum]